MVVSPNPGRMLENSSRLDALDDELTAAAASSPGDLAAKIVGGRVLVATAPAG